MRIECTCQLCGRTFAARPSAARRYCSSGCYVRTMRARAVGDLAERFWARVDRSAGPDGCWPWTGHRKPHGYGVLSVRGRPEHAHRLAYVLENGAIPEGLWVRHAVCHNPPCCNPRHLALGTPAQNTADMHRAGRAYRAIGELSSRAKLTEEAVRAIRRRRSAGEQVRALAREFGVHEHTIYRVVTGQRWGHLS